MHTLTSVMAALKSKASEKTRTTYVRHGAPAGRTLGVSVADQKLIAKTIKGQQALACELYGTGVFEAMYLAGMVADGAQLTKEELHAWADAADMQMISEYTVPWVAVESAHAHELTMEWIQSSKEHVAASGWCTYSGLAATRPDEGLDLAEIEGLLKAIPEKLAAAPNRVRYSMNGFVISVGTYVAPLLKQAVAVARKIGTVSVDVGDTACKVPLATDYIAKIEAMGRIGAKRKTIRC